MTIPDGWSSQTGFRHGYTKYQRDVIATALAMSGQSSGQSITGGSWLTDTYKDKDHPRGDGDAMRAATTIWVGWKKAPGKETETQVIKRMTDKLTSYNTTDAGKLAVQIKAVASATTVVPTTDNATMDLLKIRPQCKERLDRWVNDAKGKVVAINYPSGTLPIPKDIRPGMALVRVDKTHATLIRDVEFKNGSIINVIRAEANLGDVNPWSNPGGQIPWERTVRTDKSTSVSAMSGTWNVIDYYNGYK